MKQGGGDRQGTSTQPPLGLLDACLWTVATECLDCHMSRDFLGTGNPLRSLTESRSPERCVSEVIVAIIEVLRTTRSGSRLFPLADIQCGSGGSAAG